MFGEVTGPPHGQAGVKGADDTTQENIPKFKLVAEFHRAHGESLGGL